MRLLTLATQLTLALCWLCLPVPAAADGELDPTFGTDGILVIDADISTTEQSLAEVLVQPDDKIVVAGTFSWQGNPDFYLKRFNPDGTEDPMFASGFSVTIGFDHEPNGPDRAYAATLRPNGAILIGGTAADSAGGGNRVALAQLTDDGSPDTSFGPGGLYSFRPDGLQNVSLRDLDGTADPDVVRGIGRVGSSDSILDLVIFHPVGAPATITRYFQAPLANWSEAWAMTELRYGRQVFAGALASNSGGFFDTGLLAFSSATGQPDPAFGDAGWQRVEATSTGNSWDSVTYAIAHYPGKRVVAAGRATRNGEEDALVVRLLEDGLPDPTFGVNGQRYMAWSTEGGHDDQVLDLSVQSDGHVVFGGSAEGPFSSTYPVVARLDASGAYDLVWAGQGWRRLPDPPGYELRGAPSIAFQRDGKLIAAGTARSMSGGPSKVYIMRLLSSHVLFADGFEAGDLSRWSSTAP